MISNLVGGALSPENQLFPPSPKPLTRQVDRIMRTFPAVTSSWQVHAGLLEKRGLPSIPSHYQKVCHLISSRNKRYLHSFNALKPPMLSACDCSPSWTWERYREGDFFCKLVRGEPLIQYRNGGYHPVYLGDSLHEGRYIIINRLGWERYGTVWLAMDSR